MLIESLRNKLIVFNLIFFTFSASADLSSQVDCPAGEVYVNGQGCVKEAALSCRAQGGQWFAHDSGSTSCVYNQSGGTDTDKTVTTGGGTEAVLEPYSTTNPSLPPKVVTPASPGAQPKTAPTAKAKGPAEDLGNGKVKTPDGREITQEEWQAEQDQQRQELKSQSEGLQAEAQKCLIARRDAQSCCNQPMSCLTGRENPEVAGAVATLTGLIGTGVAMYAGQQNGGTNPGMQACKTLQYLGLGAGGLNGVLGGVCTTRKLSCDSTCGEIYKKANELIAANCSGPSASRSENCRALLNARSTAQTSLSSCSALNANIQEMGGQAISSLSGAGIASLCNQLSGSSTGFASLDRPPVFTGDCSNPANASNPACVNCSGPNAATNPLCKTTPPPGLGDGPTSTSLAKANYGTSKESGSNVAGLESAGTQAAVTPTITPEANKNAGVQGGGGGGLGGAAAPANNDLGNQNPGVAGGPNADIMQGTTGGNGFSGYASAPQTGGGEGGYSGYGGGSSEYKAPGFNLAQYLPGGKKAVAGRGLAAAAVGKSAELGNIQDDIWFRQTKYLNKWCRGDRIKCGVL